MPKAELRMITSDSVSSIFLKVVDFITEDGHVVSHESIFVNSGQPHEMWPLYRMANSLGIARLSNGSEYEIIGSEYAIV
jgi:hypothetical protein